MSSKLIFITGATGFIGSHVVLATLQAGHRVRLSVRQQEQIEHLRRTYAQFSDQIDYIVVIPDIARLKFDFEKILDGVDHIFHLAGPMPGKGGEDVKTGYINPAVKADEAILAAAMHQPSIRTVIMMSSHQATSPSIRIGTQGKKLRTTAVSTKHGANEEEEGTVMELLDTNFNFPPGPLGHVFRYQTSKILAHQACKKFMSTKTPHFKLITIHPVFVLGDSLEQHQGNHDQVIDESRGGSGGRGGTGGGGGGGGKGGMNTLLWASLIQSEKPKSPRNWVHVRDVADLHVKLLDDTALGAKVVGGGGTIVEIGLSGPVVDWNEVLRRVQVMSW